MADKTEIAISVMPKLEERVVELSEKLESIARERAPEAWDAALGVVTVDAVQDIVLSIAFLLLAVAVAHISTKALIWGKRGQETQACSEIHIVAEIFSYFGLGGALVSAGTALFGLFSVWNYVALFHPELAIARRVLDGIL